ncbi:hypothetical protein [uncultured Sphingobium sp.]|uniref:hypothetical protein n=1 Tax=uncultured Sphingobium sp. TaxID=316087 RepID=UPI00259B3B3F|nr:hypothetical protein [uncultured Sphingobium sp.]
MSGVLIIAPAPHGALPVAAGSGASNLLTFDPKEIWAASSVNPVEIQIDMGTPVAIDSFFLGYTNAAPGAFWAIYSNTAPGTGHAQLYQGPMRAADSLGPRHHAFRRIAAPVTSRYFSIAVYQSGAVPLYAGALVLGRAFEKYRERGAGRTLIDTGERQDLPGGGFNMGGGVLKAQFAFSFIDLTDAETFRLEQIKRNCGLRKPVLLIEDADLAIGQNEAIHYGVFERFQARESADADVSRWAGSVLEWA